MLHSIDFCYLQKFWIFDGITSIIIQHLDQNIQLAIEERYFAYSHFVPKNFFCDAVTFVFSQPYAIGVWLRLQDIQ